MSTVSTVSRAATSGVTIRLAEPTDYDAVRALLLEAYESRFWITEEYRAMLRDIEGHVAPARTCSSRSTAR